MEEQKYCYKYPHPAVTTDCVVFGFDGHELKILLIERGREPYKGYWAFPGGFLNMDENATQGALRELAEETGLKLEHIKEFGTFSDVGRDPRERVISIAFYALAKKSDLQGGDDAAKAQWFPLNEVPRLAFDHDYMLRKAMQKLKEDIHFEPIGFDLLGDSFTMPELQRLYESILGVQFDRRNFYKKMLQTGILEEIDEDPSTAFFGSHREMRSMSIDALFGTPKPSPSYSTSRQSDDDSRRRKRTRFSFNKKRYDEFKEDHNFRLEF
ncbi:MAG: NUDIX hydrolase [Bacteroidales bacterium]|nr:NUDIX hydrolase [Bacteroidales bacterium]